MRLRDLWWWNQGGLTLFGFFFFFAGIVVGLAIYGERQKNDKVHVMQENVIYIRPVGFEELTPKDTIYIEHEDNN